MPPRSGQAPEQRVAELLNLLELETLEVNLFRGASRDIGSPQVFGGQVLGQALRAAYATVTDRVVHSLHAYFLRRGDFNAPIVYQVERSLDGHSFANRHVVGIQHGAQIFNMTASFQVREEGFDHQIEMPQVPAPEALPEFSLPPVVLDQLPQGVRRFIDRARPFDFRLVQQVDYVRPHKEPPRREIWFRAVAPLPEGDDLHRCLLAYVSDYFLLDTATLPHGRPALLGNIMMASIDHAMWFHRPLRMDQWLLYALESPSASNARGFARASVFSQDGRLIASTAQEGLVRVKRD